MSNRSAALITILFLLSVSCRVVSGSAFPATTPTPLVIAASTTSGILPTPTAAGPTSAATPASTETPVAATATAVVTGESQEDACLTSQPEWPVYTVVAGDTLFSIARASGSSIDEIALANCLEDSSLLNVGQQLLVPQIPATPTPTGAAVVYSLEVEPYLWVDDSQGYMLETGRTVVIHWTPPPSLPAGNQLEILFYPHAGEGPSTSIFTQNNVTGPVDLTWVVPPEMSGELRASVRLPGQTHQTGQEQAARVQSRGSTCTFVAYGIGGDVPVYHLPQFDSPVIHHLSMNDRAQVIDQSGYWHVEGNGQQGRFLKIEIGYQWFGWVQDSRGGVEGECSEFDPEASIEYFRVSPSAANPGDVVTLSWRATGRFAQICPQARFTFFTEGDCQQVVPSGHMNFTVPAALQPSYSPSFLLRVEGLTSQAESRTALFLYCDRLWFYEDETPFGPICPQEATVTQAAVQHFQHGTMVWLDDPGRYIAFIGQPLDQAPKGQRFSTVVTDDPLQIVADTSGDYDPPSGLYAPASGFGYVWRGDTAGMDPMLAYLGWATAPETGVTADFQCDDAVPTSGGAINPQSCYLQLPGGEVIWMGVGLRQWMVIGDR